VVDRQFLPGGHALMVPKTSDGRVLFGVPWLGKVILGTTDTPRHDLPDEPRPFKEELEFILRESARYLTKAPTRADVRSAWVGLRPLVKPLGEEGDDTKQLSREHTVLVSRSGLLTVTGGKWTTYRAMAEDVLEKCADKRLLERTRPGLTANLKLIGGGAVDGPRPALSEAQGLHSYGSEAHEVNQLEGAGRQLGAGLTEAMVRFAARAEYARTVEDVLARRWRVLFLDAKLAGSMASAVGAILQQETGVDPQSAAFEELARLYRTLPAE
jgi:glycerol-3-phosphate dehydrogenase